MNSGILTQGEQVKKFESSISRYHGGGHSLAVNSGTSALLLAMKSLGIKNGDEVLVPAFTFAATANAVALTGATPILVDCKEDSFNMDPEKAIRSLSKRTKAIIAVHLFGLPCEMDSLQKIVSENNLYLVEDVAQAFGAKYKNQLVGTFGDAAAFSFYATKNITTGEGGALLLKDSKVFEKARCLRNQGMINRYEYVDVGFNLRMTEMSAALGNIQLKRLQKLNDKRARNATIWNKFLPEALRLNISEDFHHVFHQYTIRICGLCRPKLIDYLKARDISIGIYYPKGLHQYGIYNSQDSSTLSVTEKLSSEVISLPVHPKVTKKQIKYASEQIRCFFRGEQQCHHQEFHKALNPWLYSKPN